ncbi:MAG: hypothetical protein KJO35_05660, partial [Gammaproteobacteria bacterium]|nr:hypothetical protein [Gammaproteobacteria bacterium]
VYSVLPFVGAEESEAAGTVGYRAILLETSIRVAAENPWFGSTTFHNHPDMNAIRQSSGLLDLVNHYLIVVLNYGYVGLAAFVSIFACVLLRLRRALKKSRKISEHQRVFCRAIMFTIVGLLVAITTTSAFGRVGLILWALAAISAVATGLLLDKGRDSASVRTGHPASAFPRQAFGAPSTGGAPEHNRR